MYVISVHSTICSSYTDCKTPISRKEKGFPVFKIPKNTFVISFPTAGETCWFDDFKLISNARDDIRKWLVTTDKTDAAPSTNSSYFGLSSLYRATDALYPNISCSFQEKPGVSINDLGVFDLNKTREFINRNSIIKKTDKSPHAEEPTGSEQSWYLDELIQRVYEKTGIAKGIFIFVGCLANFNDELEAIHALDEAEQLIRMADLTYTSRVPTVGAELIDEGLRPMNHVFRNLSHDRRHVLEPSAHTMASLTHSLRTTLGKAFPNAKQHDTEEFKKAQGVLREIRKSAT